MLDGLRMHSPPAWLQALFPAVSWRGAEGGTQVYLSFDDGPVPGPTEWVLDQLAGTPHKASFFCIGKNVRQHPEIFRRILREGHAVGNHTTNHLNGWKHGNREYFADVNEADEIMAAEGGRSLLFRPPYGKLTPSQYRELSRTHHISLWDVLPYDFDRSISGEQVFASVEKHLRPGGMVVLHDSPKAFPRLQKALPLILQLLDRNGWTSVALPPAGLKEKK